MEETKRRRFIIRAVLEGEVDVQEQPQPGRVPVLEWDFTESLIDKKQNHAAILTGTGIARTENGLEFTAAAAECFLGDDVFPVGSTVEVDIPYMNRTATNHCRLVMFDNVASPAAGDEVTEGFILRSSNPRTWAFYKGSWSYGYSNDQNLFSGKTLVMKYYFDETDSKYHTVVYCDDDLLADYTSSTPWNSYDKNPLFIGGKSNAYAKCTVSGIRIYNEV